MTHQRIGGTINSGARQAPRTTSAEHGRGARARSKHTLTSRSRGAPWLEQVTSMACAGRRGFERRKDSAIAVVGICTGAPGAVSCGGITTLA